MKAPGWDLKSEFFASAVDLSWSGWESADLVVSRTKGREEVSAKSGSYSYLLARCIHTYTNRLSSQLVEFTHWQCPNHLEIWIEWASKLNTGANSTVPGACPELELPVWQAGSGAWQQPAHLSRPAASAEQVLQQDSTCHNPLTTNTPPLSSKHPTFHRKLWLSSESCPLSSNILQYQRYWCSDMSCVTQQ